MVSKLTNNEKRFLDKFLKSVDVKKISPKFSYLYSGVISFLGLILFTASVLMTINKLNDRVVYWVFLPGVIGGVGTILLGVFILKYFKRIEEKNKLAAIIKKLLN